MMGTESRKSRAGMTLLEVMISVAILGLVSGALYGLAASLGQAAQFQEAKASTLDEARSAMMVLTRELHQASNVSFDTAVLPNTTLQYRVADDVDGNGTAVNESVVLELSPLRTVSLDVNDLNGDGETTTQLILSDGTNVRVLANGLVPIEVEDSDGDGLPDLGGDLNNNGRIDQGILFERDAVGLVVTVMTQRRIEPDGPFVISRLQETVFARN